jgi:aryl-alcohol dehydrogenase-like predicted oxidoreductase
MKRILGRSSIQVSAAGMGCWAIGGPWNFQGSPAGWGSVDDAESIRAIHAALDAGTDFFDTAANYGAGHSERLLGRALAGRRSEAVIATKFGYDLDEQAKEVVAYGDVEETADIAGHLRQDCEASLKRLNSDYIDIYQLHAWGYDIEKSLEVRQILEELVAEGKIRTYGWSTDRLDAVQSFAEGPNCGVVQQELNVFLGNLDLLSYCEEENLGSLNRAPLGMGILTGKFAPNTRFAANDIRALPDMWFEGFEDGGINPLWLQKLDSVREILTSNGRTLAQGALAWIWGASPLTVPIPGFKTVEQVQENAGAMAFGPLTPQQMNEIDDILGREHVLS